MSARIGFTNLAGPASDAAAPLPIGSQIEAHSVLQVLSEGPNGFVYLTRDAAHGATRVLKEFMPRSRMLRLSDGSVRPCDVSDSIATSVARIAFMNEANTLAAFEHPALVRVLGVIPAHRTLYRVMPLVDGVSLEQHCRTRAEAPSLAWLQGVVEGLLQALQVLHERRLGHGAVWPAQVMVRESGQPLLLGFASVARELDAASPTPWQSPGAAHLTRHAPPLPADDLPALAETVFFAATGFQAPTLQQRSEGAPFDLRQVVGSLADGPGDTQQRRRGLLLALEAGFAASREARPQSVAEFRRLMTGDVPARGGRHEPTPRWVGEMPERDKTEVDLLIPQPAPLADDLPPTPRPAAALAPVEPLEPLEPIIAMRLQPVAAAFSSHEEPRVEPLLQPAMTTAWPFEPVQAQPPQPASAPPSAPPTAPPAAAIVETVPANEAEPAAEAALEPLGERVVETPPQSRRRSTVERDFAATEFLVASGEPADATIIGASSAPDSEPFVASLRPQPPRRSRAGALAAVAALALVGVGIAAWWKADPGVGGSTAALPVAPVQAVTRPETTVAPQPAPSVAPPPAAKLTPASEMPAATATATPTPTPTPTPTAAAPVAAPKADGSEPVPAVTAAATVAPATRATAAVIASTARNRTASAQTSTPRPAQPRATTVAAARPATVNPRPVASASTDASRALRARSPLAACGSRTQFSLVYCMQQQCKRPAYKAHPQCADLRNGG